MYKISIIGTGSLGRAVSTRLRQFNYQIQHVNKFTPKSILASSNILIFCTPSDAFSDYTEVLSKLRYKRILSMISDLDIEEIGKIAHLTSSVFKATPPLTCEIGHGVIPTLSICNNPGHLMDINHLLLMLGKPVYTYNEELTRRLRLASACSLGVMGKFEECIFNEIVKLVVDENLARIIHSELLVGMSMMHIEGLSRKVMVPRSCLDFGQMVEDIYERMNR